MTEKLGSLIWYTIPGDFKIQVTEWRELTEKHDAIFDGVKKPIESNLFRRAWVQLEKDYGWKTKVKQSSDKVIKNSLITPEGLQGYLTINKKTGRIRIRGTGDQGQSANLYEAKAYIESFIRDNIGYIHDIIFRFCIKNTIEDILQGLQVKSGGVFFVAESRKRDFQKVVSTLEDIPTISVGVIPVFNNPETQKVIALGLDQYKGDLLLEVQERQAKLFAKQKPIVADYEKLLDFINQAELKLVTLQSSLPDAIKVIQRSLREKMNPE